MTDLQDMTRVEKIIWLLGNKLSEQEQNDISDMVQETIQSFKQSDKDAGLKLDYLWSRLKLDKLEAGVQVELQNELLHAIKGQAGYHQAADYLWDTGTRLAPLKETTVTGADIVGKDSNLQGDLYHRRKHKDGLHRQEPKKRKYDEDEDDIEKKLEQLKKLFNDRNKKKITLTDIKKILQSESIEFRSIIRERLKAASALIEDEPDCKQELLEHYFTEGNILNDSSPTSSTFNHNAWSGYRYVRLKDNVVIATNTALVQNGSRLSNDKIAE